MIRLSVLASSSRGNASVITGGRTSILVDVGISATRIRQGLSACGLEISALAGIFITHEHADHVCGLGVLARKAPLHLYCSRYLAPDLKQAAPSAQYTYMEPGASVRIGDLTVTSFSVSHDASDPVGYIIECEGCRLGYITDTGRITRDILAQTQGLDALYLESNYDPNMLAQSGRPRYLIDRIASNWGHLSNTQAADFIRQIAHPGLQHLILGHLSQECNTPALAHAHMQATLDELHLPTCLHCAEPYNRLPWIDILPPRHG